MNLYPAIDLRAGRAVRLEQGDFSRETVYGDDPVAIAKRFSDAGAQWIHVVDLDGARDGTDANLEQIRLIASAVPCSVQVGGGIRNENDVTNRLRLGVDRVVMGTMAVENPDLVCQLAQQFPNQIAVGLDARGRTVAVRGWVERGGSDLIDLATRYDATAVAAIIVTEIARDGMMMGPDLDQLAAVLAATAIPVIASGGIGELADITALNHLRAGGHQLEGAITGRAIYENRFSVGDALDACSDACSGD